VIAGLLPHRCRTLQRGDILFRQGDPAAGIFGVTSGAVRLERRTLDGRLVVLHTARAGSYFAEGSLFSETYHCDAAAVSEARVEFYPKLDILRLIHQDPATSVSLLATMARQLQATRARLELRNVRSARDRVLLWLDMNAEPDRHVRMDGDLQDVAAEIGLTREAFYRALARLERESVVTRRAGSILLRHEPIA
jgi:CRP-like cAMP-binding protein